MDKEIVYNAIQDTGSALQYAVKSLRNDKKIVMAAVRNKGTSIV